MLQLPLTDGAGNVSHPYRILLRLVADNPGIETLKLLLALEARDDGPQEYARITALSKLNFPGILKAIKVGEANARNAVKIIPGIAEQVGDIRRRRNNTTVLVGADATTEDGPVVDVSPAEYERTQPPAPVAIAPDDIAPIPNFGPIGAADVDLTAAHALRQKRTILHQRTTVSIARVLGGAGFTTYANPYDCLAHKTGRGSLLIEVKTLDGSRADERRQSEKALGQLRGYRFFSLSAPLRQPRLVELVAFSQRPSDDAAAFLYDSGVSSVWLEGPQWVGAYPNGQITNFAPDAFLS
jgi:hypothetical protein